MRECILEVSPQILNVLEPDVQSDRVFWHAKTMVRIQWSSRQQAKRDWEDQTFVPAPTDPEFEILERIDEPFDAFTVGVQFKTEQATGSLEP